MPVFEYKGRNNQGQAVSGNIDASSSDAVATQLMSSGITPIDIVLSKIKIRLRKAKSSKLTLAKIKNLH